MSRNIFTSARPTVWLMGEIDHPDFTDAIAQIRADGCVVGEQGAPEVIVVAQSRPGAISERLVQSARRAAPLAGLVGLLGSWCEGETRTGRPWPGVTRLYWYEFPPWWHLQLKRRAAGLCPDWARPGSFGFRHPEGTRVCRLRNLELRDQGNRSFGVVALRTYRRETAGVLATVFQRAGYSTVWHGARCSDFVVRGMLAGIWDGGQLGEHEAEDLSGYCRALSRDAAPVVALLDFPRRDSLERATQCGAATVLGKPWRNGELIAAVEMSVSQSEAKRAA